MAEQKSFKVAGAGEIRFSEDVRYTGGSCGIGLYCSWDAYDGQCGGVMDIDEMERLVSHFHEWLKAKKVQAIQIRETWSITPFDEQDAQETQKEEIPAPAPSKGT